MEAFPSRPLSPPRVGRGGFSGGIDRLLQSRLSVFEPAGSFPFFSAKTPLEDGVPPDREGATLLSTRIEGATAFLTGVFFSFRSGTCFSRAVFSSKSENFLFPDALFSSPSSLPSPLPQGLFPGTVFPADVFFPSPPDWRPVFFRDSSPLLGWELLPLPYVEDIPFLESRTLFSFAFASFFSPR